jgi:CRISPR-associated exonuclease Cas4
MKQFSEDELVPMSALSQICYCERRLSLIHIEKQWDENRFTAEGKVLHERVHAEHHESRKLFRQEYDMYVRSLKYGLTGKCDLVELWYNKDGNVEKISPVEFKRGKKKTDDVDRVQLCAQVLCLEEMFGILIESGQFYYFQEHRRRSEIIDALLREKTIALIERIMKISKTGETAAAIYEKRKCDNCSLVDWCMPKNTGAGYKQVDRYIKTQMRLTDKDYAKTS